LPAPDELHPHGRLGHVDWRMQQPRRPLHAADCSRFRDLEPRLPPLREAPRNPRDLQPLRRRQPDHPPQSGWLRRLGSREHRLPVGEQRLLLGPWDAPLLSKRETLRWLLPLREPHESRLPALWHWRVGLRRANSAGGRPPPSLTRPLVAGKTPDVFPPPRGGFGCPTSGRPAASDRSRDPRAPAV